MKSIIGDIISEMKAWDTAAEAYRLLSEDHVETEMPRRDHFGNCPFIHC
jgi:hypothetical protein